MRRPRRAAQAAVGPDGRTLFGRYLDLEAMTRAEAARELGVTVQAIGQWVRGVSWPGADTMWAAEQWSDGAVPMQSWFCSGDE